MRRANASADPRRAAVEVLVRVEKHGSHAARLLGGATPMQRELVLGVLRWQLTLDTLLGRHVRPQLARLDCEVRACLRVGLYEAARLRTPVPVAVAEAVRVARSVAPKASGLVNAVLRRAVAESWPDPSDESIPLAVRYSHPEWLVARWLARLGREAAAAALAVAQEPAPLWLFAAASDCARLDARGCALAPHPAVAGVVRVSGDVGPAIDALTRGEAYAIDPTAVLIARLLAGGGGPRADLAAAPGGKSLVLASERAAAVHVACDRHLGRTAMMRASLARLSHPPHALVSDGQQPCLRPGRFATVLLDAPCSGTGTLRRHPEIRWRLQLAHLEGLAATQRRLATAASSLVDRGGLLLYATCSLEPEENEGAVADLPLERVSLQGAVPPAMRAIDLPSGGALIPPSALGDGFVAHLFRRTG